jgi:uncharacterized membrane protein YcaP (DUF421 family)
MDGYLKVLVFSAVAAVYLFIMAKFLGKKQIAQLDVIDYMLGIAVSSIAAEMSVDSGSQGIFHYLIPMSFFFVLNLIIIFLERKGKNVKKFIKGVPLMVIYQGKIDYNALKKSKMDINDLIAKSRDKGYFDLNDIEYAIFENSGGLSIMPKGEKKALTIEDTDKRIPQAKLPFYIIDDGTVSKSTLRTLNKDTAWLYEKLNIQTKKDLKNIILAVYNEDTDEITVSAKEG